MLVKVKKFRMICVWLSGLPHALYSHHVCIPMEICKERTSVQPIIMPCGSGVALDGVHIAFCDIVYIIWIVYIVYVITGLSCFRRTFSRNVITAFL